MMISCPAEVASLLASLSDEVVLTMLRFLLYRLTQIAAYGRCAAMHADEIEKGVCEKEFAALKKCFRKVCGSC
jgi:hypothetical protein